MLTSPSEVMESGVVGSGVDVESVDDVFDGRGVSVWVLLMLVLIENIPKSWRRREETTSVILN